MPLFNCALWVRFQIPTETEQGKKGLNHIFRIINWPPGGMTWETNITQCSSNLETMIHPKVLYLYMIHFLLYYILKIFTVSLSRNNICFVPLQNKRTRRLVSGYILLCKSCLREKRPKVLQNTEKHIVSMEKQDQWLFRCFVWSRCM